MYKQKEEARVEKKLKDNKAGRVQLMGQNSEGTGIRVEIEGRALNRKGVSTFEQMMVP